MIKVDLVTGLLGAGKTTFIKKYAEYFIKQQAKVGILINDHGAVNVDMLLLHELRGDYCELEMVAGGCDMDCHIRRFKSKLIAMAMSGYDRVIIEPSGLFDIDEFFDVLHDEPLDRWYEVGSVITIVEASLKENMNGFMSYMFASQTAVAGCIVLSKIDKYYEKKLDTFNSSLVCKDSDTKDSESGFKNLSEPLKEKLTEDLIVDLNQKILYYLSGVNCKRDLKDAIIAKPFESLTDDDFRHISACGYCHASFEKQYSLDQGGFETVYIMQKELSKELILSRVKKLFSDRDRFGEVYRVKGFFAEDNAWYELNATADDLELNQISAGQEVVIIIGRGLDEKVLTDFLVK